MTTTILTDEQIETLFREHDDLYAFCHAIAAAVLQSEQVQARMEAYATEKVREAMSAAYEKAAQRSMSMPHYSDFYRGYAEGRSHAAMEIREFIPGPVEPTA